MIPIPGVSFIHIVQMCEGSYVRISRSFGLILDEQICELINGKLLQRSSIADSVDDTIYKS